jgi:hypothetical protein
MHIRGRVPARAGTAAREYARVVWCVPPDLLGAMRLFGTPHVLLACVKANRCLRVPAGLDASTRECLVRVFLLVGFNRALQHPACVGGVSAHAYKQTIACACRQALPLFESVVWCV